MCETISYMREPTHRSWDRKYPANRITHQEQTMIDRNLGSDRIQDLDQRRNIWSPVRIIPNKPRAGVAPQCVAVGQTTFKCSHIKTFGSAALQKLTGKDAY